MVMMLYFQYPFTAQFAKRSSINELISADYGFPLRKLYMSGKYFMSQKYYFTTANLHYFISILILSFSFVISFWSGDCKLSFLSLSFRAHCY